MAVESNIGQGTGKLYYEDAYLTDFTAKVISWEQILYKCGDIKEPILMYDVVLDRTAFFPEEGGQSPDRGVLEDNLVLDVRIEKGIIHHYLKIDTSPAKKGDIVYGTVDRNHRFSNMQQHSAEHIFSGIVKKHLGYDNVGFHLSDNDVTMDYSGVISDEDIIRFEKLVNLAVYKNIKSETRILPSGSLDDIEYRSKLDIDGEVRIVTFPGYDVCACCAPHVDRTGEIGLFKVISHQNYKGGTRIHMLAGERAFNYLASIHGMMTSLARGMTTSTEMVENKIDSMKNEIIRLKNDVSSLNEKLMWSEIEKIPAEKKKICVFTENTDGRVFRNAIKRIGDSRDICGFFDGNDEEGYRYVIAGNTDVTPVHDEMKEKFGAKGGGQKTMVQGSVSACAEELKGLFE
ncbi:MAG: alanyl-tRNA editing protein [Lachnospiraceae bacterium]|jgi:alanyl-tRNA synthetase